MNIYYNGFTQSFLEKYNYNTNVFQYILEKTFNKNINITTDINIADILFETIDVTSVLEYKKWKYSFYFIPQSNIILPTNSGLYSIVFTSNIIYNDKNIVKYVDGTLYNFSEENIVSTSIQDNLLKPIKIYIHEIINAIRLYVNNADYYVDIICNMDYELERLSTLKEIYEYYNIIPTYAVWGNNTLKHPYVNKFENRAIINQRSLAINHINTLERYKNIDKYLVMFESDATPNNINMHNINKTILEIIETMKQNDINFVFIGKGCFDNVDTNTFYISVNTPECKNTVDFRNIVKYNNGLYVTNGSRCTEAYIVSPKGINEYLQYFYNNINHTHIDWDYGNFLCNNKHMKSCWRIPELFKQAGYKSFM
jgi:hypothetical protein